MNMLSALTLIPARWTPAPWVATSLSALIMAWWLMEGYYWSNFPAGAVYKDRHSNPLIVLSIFINLGVCLTLSAYGRGVWHYPPLLVPVLGLMMAAGGLMLRLASIRLLGRFYTSRVALHPDHQLVEHGVLRLLRHPAYTGALLLGLGMSVALANWWASLFFLATHVPVILYRIRVEERALAEQFGERYRAYQSRTWGLIPLVY